MLLLSGCAQIVPPTGGPKDDKAPVVTGISPPNKSIHFSSTKITLYFDEYVLLKDAEEQVIVSPPLKEKPEVSTKGKAVELKFITLPEKNKTYTINFGNAIVDNHEGKSIDDLTYVFSTGSYLDTAYTKGTVSNAFTEKPEKDVVVALYSVQHFTDTTIYKQTPAYFSKTDERGEFLLENIPTDTFYLLAFKDDNRNLVYNKNERVAIWSNPLILNPYKTDIELSLFNPPPYRRNRILDTFSRETGKFTFVVYSPTSVRVTPLCVNKYFEYKKTGKENVDTVFIFVPGGVTDSCTFRYAVADSILDLRIKTRKNSRLPPLTYAINRTLELNDTIRVELSNPTQRVDLKAIKLLEDTNTVTPDYVKVEKERESSISVYYPWKEKMTYTLLIGDSAIVDIYNQYNPDIKGSFTTKSQKDYGTLLLTVTKNHTDTPYILQLVDTKEENIARSTTLNGSTKLTFNYLLPNTYRIKLIEDANRNGKWDNGDLDKQKFPEKVFYYKNEIVVRAYWDVEQSMDADEIVK
jgi:hypothetical protein